MSRITSVRVLFALVAATLASLWSIPAVQAGGGPPPAINFDVEAVYINCVDDEVDEPGIDGDALVRVRVTNNSAQDVEVTDGSWRVVSDGVTHAFDSFITPADLAAGATWEQVVRIPGDTGPAAFAAMVDVTNVFSTTTLALIPSLPVPGDCPQPDDSEETTTTIEPTPATVDDVVTVRPRFTG